jgi:hypothetical protein
VQGGRYFSSSFAGKKILFQPMFSLKKLRFLLELILERGMKMAGNGYRYYVLDFLVHPVAEEGEVAL